jgi:hypothetical protein
LERAHGVREARADVLPDSVEQRGGQLAGQGLFVDAASTTARKYFSFRVSCRLLPQVR